MDMIIRGKKKPDDDKDKEKEKEKEREREGKGGSPEKDEAPRPPKLKKVRGAPGRPQRPVWGFSGQGWPPACSRGGWVRGGGRGGGGRLSVGGWSHISWGGKGGAPGLILSSPHRICCRVSMRSEYGAVTNMVERVAVPLPPLPPPPGLGAALGAGDGGDARCGPRAGSLRGPGRWPPSPSVTHVHRPDHGMAGSERLHKRVLCSLSLSLSPSLSLPLSLPLSLSLSLSRSLARSLSLSFSLSVSRARLSRRGRGREGPPGTTRRRAQGHCTNTSRMNL